MDLSSFLHFFIQEIAFFDVTKTGELLSRLSEDTQVIKNAATVNLSETLRSLTTSLVGVGFMFQTSWQLTCNKCFPSLKIHVNNYSYNLIRYRSMLTRYSYQYCAACARYMHMHKLILYFSGLTVLMINWLLNIVTML